MGAMKTQQKNVDCFPTAIILQDELTCFIFPFTEIKISDKKKTKVVAKIRTTAEVGNIMMVMGKIDGVLSKLGKAKMYEQSRCNR